MFLSHTHLLLLISLLSQTLLAIPTSTPYSLLSRRGNCVSSNSAANTTGPCAFQPFNEPPAYLYNPGTISTTSDIIVRFLVNDFVALLYWRSPDLPEAAVHRVAVRAHNLEDLMVRLQALPQQAWSQVTLFYPSEWGYGVGTFIIPESFRSRLSSTTGIQFTKVVPYEVDWERMFMFRSSGSSYELWFNEDVGGA